MVYGDTAVIVDRNSNFKGLFGLFGVKRLIGDQEGANNGRIAQRYPSETLLKKK